MEENGLEVRSIEDYKEELRLFEPIMDLVDKKLWGIASDALRYNIIEIFGGVYSDLNFKFLRSIERNLHQYDFIFQGSNNFFAAKINHPIIKHVVDIVENHYVNPPEYLTNINDIFDKTIIFTLIHFVARFLEYNNQDNNIDVMFYQNLYRNQDLDNKEQCTTNQKFLSLYSKFNITGIENVIVGMDNYDSNEYGASWLQNMYF